jgi:hypothetical protein
MILQAEITALVGGRKTTVPTNYRVDWKIVPDDETLWGASVLLEREKLAIGETCQGVLRPLSSDFWKVVKIGDVITGFEGRRATVEAKIVNVFLDRDEDE